MTNIVIFLTQFLECRLSPFHSERTSERQTILPQRDKKGEVHEKRKSEDGSKDRGE